MSTVILSNHFFSEHKPSVEFFSQWLGVTEWSEKILPVYQWQDVVYVASSAPITDQITAQIQKYSSQKKIKIIYVLSDLDSLKQCWLELQKQLQTQPKIQLNNGEADSPEGLLDINVSATPSVEQQSPEDLIAIQPQPVATVANGKPLFDITRTNSREDRSWDEVLNELNKKIHASYEKTMILIKDGKNLRPWKWDDHFHCGSNQVMSVDLNKPSPFRIVFRTQKPYHGHVVENEINKEFYKNWNEGIMPEHLTLAPIIVGEHVVGMLLAIGKQTANDKSHLLLCENLAIQLGQKIEADPPIEKAA